MIPPVVSNLRIAYWRLETGSRTAYALQFAMDSGPAAGAAAAACAAIEADKRALRTVASLIWLPSYNLAGINADYLNRS
jgi:hypothetical protein